MMSGGRTLKSEPRRWTPSLRAASSSLTTTSSSGSHPRPPLYSPPRGCARGIQVGYFLLGDVVPIVSDPFGIVVVHIVIFERVMFGAEQLGHTSAVARILLGQVLFAHPGLVPDGAAALPCTPVEP